MKKSIYNLVATLIGNALLALGVSLFVSPTHLIMGGGTGIAFALNNYFGIDISFAVLVINIIMFIIGLLFLGKKFAMLTIVSTIVYPLFLQISQQLVAFYQPTFDLLISTIFGGLFIGLGIGLVLRQGASTGGMDIPPILLNKKLGIPTSVLIYAFDFVIIMAQAFSTDVQSLLYSLIILFISSVAIDRTLMLGSTQTQVVIITPKYSEINNWIHHHIDRGTTYLEITTGLHNESQKAVMCVLSKRQLHALNEGIASIDPTAFTIISEVHEVKGRGFTLPNIDLPI